MWRRRSGRGAAGGRLLRQGATGLSQPTHTHTDTFFPAALQTSVPPSQKKAVPKVAGKHPLNGPDKRPTSDPTTSTSGPRLSKENKGKPLEKAPQAR